VSDHRNKKAGRQRPYSGCSGRHRPDRGTKRCLPGQAGPGGTDHTRTPKNPGGAGGGPIRCNLKSLPIPLTQVLGPWDNPRAFSEFQTRQKPDLHRCFPWNYGPDPQAVKQYAGESRDGGKPPQAYQELRFKLAELFTLFQTSRWMLYRRGGCWRPGPRRRKPSPQPPRSLLRRRPRMSPGAPCSSWVRRVPCRHDAEECFRDARLGPVAGNRRRCSGCGLPMIVWDDINQAFRVF